MVRAMPLGPKGWALMNGADFASSSRKAVAKTPADVERFAAREVVPVPARGLSEDAEVYDDGQERFRLVRVA
jgi:hypothetical protein